MLWTDADNDKMVRDHFPFFLNAYNKLPGGIEKADVSRYMYLYKYGGNLIHLLCMTLGVYADLDVESIAPIDRVLEKSELALCLMGDAGWEHSTPNSWMASKPGHSFWIFLLTRIIEKIDVPGQTEYKTG